MYRNLILPICIAALLAGYTAKAGTITIETTHEGALAGFFLAGNGKATIDWGDGTPIETVVDLTPLPDDLIKMLLNDAMNFPHTYSASGAKTITVTGGVTGLIIYEMLDVIALDVSKNQELLWLRCNDSNLSTLDVSQNTALTQLYCFRNKLSTLDVSKNTALAELYCGYNNLSMLDVSQNTALRWLDCEGNKLSMLDVSKNTALAGLDCGDNNLSMLDVSKNTTLTWLSCFWNRLSMLDVSKNTALAVLKCYGNNLSTLDVSQNIALTRLGCSRNKISALDVSKNTALSRLECNNNDLIRDVLVAVFNALPKRDAGGNVTIICGGNPGYGSLSASDKAIAEAKNWKVEE